MAKENAYTDHWWLGCVFSIFIGIYSKICGMEVKYKMFYVVLFILKHSYTGFYLGNCTLPTKSYISEHIRTLSLQLMNDSQVGQEVKTEVSHWKRADSEFSGSTPASFLGILFR